MKKRFVIFTIWALLAALCFQGAWAEEADRTGYTVYMEDSAFLVDRDGREIIARGIYRELFEIVQPAFQMETPPVYVGATLEAPPSQENGYGTYALLNAQGQPLTEFVYQGFEYAAGMLIYLKDGLYGVMDLSGNILIEAAYTRMIDNGEGGYLAFRTDLLDEEPDQVYLVSREGEEQATGIWLKDGMYAMSEGLAPAADAESGLYGYLNAQGMWALPPAYDWAGTFENGLASASAQGGNGLIDLKGMWFVEPRYGFAYRDAPGEPVVAGDENGAYLLRPETGEILFSCREENCYIDALPGGMAVVCGAEDARVLNDKGEELFRIDGCRSLWRQKGMGERFIAMNGEYGTNSAYLYDMSGNPVAGPYQEISMLGMKDGRMYYLAATFETTQVEYSRFEMSFWDEIPSTRRWQVIDEDGQELALFEGEYVFSPWEDRVMIQQKGDVLLADFAGNILARYGALQETQEEAAP